MNTSDWYKVAEEDKLQTPGLLVFPERIKKNIASMIKIAGSSERLWPHVKTYKMAKVVDLQMEAGIRRFKCATLGELALLISCGVDHILLALQPTQEKLVQFIKYQKKHPSIQFSTLVDNLDSLAIFNKLAQEQDVKLNLWVDINNGMNRTGIVPEMAAELYQVIVESSSLTSLGLHVYDGHLRPLDLEDKIIQSTNAFEAVDRLIKTLDQKGMKVPTVIAGGSPSFYPHSLRSNVMLSPGTTLLWDLGYKRIWKESPFLNAAVVVTRLISIPNKNIYCFDLGHKAIASEMPLPRVEIFGLEKAVHKGQSEEHLILEYNHKNNFKVGDLFYAIPYHICPTVAKYNKAYAVTEGELGTPWEIEARSYHLSF